MGPKTQKLLCQKLFKWKCAYDVLKTFNTKIKKGRYNFLITCDLIYGGDAIGHQAFCFITGTLKGIFQDGRSKACKRNII